MTGSFQREVTERHVSVFIHYTWWPLLFLSFLLRVQPALAALSVPTRTSVLSARHLEPGISGPRVPLATRSMVSTFYPQMGPFPPSTSPSPSSVFSGGR